MVKLSVHRPLRLQEVGVPRISRQSAHEGDKVINPSHPLPLPPRQYPWYTFLLEAEWTPGPECGWKDEVEEYVTPAGIYLLSFRL
jgi:hypothetical protein